MQPRQVLLLRVRIAFLGLLLAGCAVLGKLVYIQWWEGARWVEAAQADNLAYRPIPATRGNLYADDGSLLATSLPFYKLALDPTVIPEEVIEQHLEALCENLSEFFQEKPAQNYKELILQARTCQRRYVPLSKRRLNYAEKQTISQWPVFCMGRLRGGILFEKSEERFKPFGSLASRTIGFVNAERQGVGLEYSFDKYLQGKVGRALHQKTVGGHWKPLYNGSMLRPVHGHDVETTLDVNLQDVAHQSLLQLLHKTRAAYGCVALMEVHTGQIKAMANLSRTPAGCYEERYNYLVGNQGTTEPGSSFKLVSMLALLEETDLQLTNLVDTYQGTYRFHDRIMRDVKRGGFGTITLKEVFTKSSNIGLSRLVEETFRKNPERFLEYVDKLGMSRPVGFQLAGEGIPSIPRPGTPAWSGVALPWMSIGYGLKVNPLHTLTLYNAVANGGKMVKPFLVKRIKKAHVVTHEFPVTVLREKICSSRTLLKLKELLEGTVTEGTAKKSGSKFYKLAGKSGTAHKVCQGQYTHDTYASFAGYFPAEAPRYSFIVVVDSPEDAAWRFGGNIAAIIGDIANKLAAQDLRSRKWSEEVAPPQKNGSYIKAGPFTELRLLCRELKIPHQFEQVSEGDWVDIQQGQEGSVVFKTRSMPAGVVPCVLGMSFRDALFVLEQRGFSVKYKGHKGGRVVDQWARPGSKINFPKRISLVLS